MSSLNLFEESIIIFLQSHVSDSFYAFLKVMADFGDEMILVGIVGFVYWCYDKKIGLKMIEYLSFSYVFASMTKNIVKRIRPYMNNREVACIKPAFEGDPYDISTQSYSFPSVHMVNSAGVYGKLFVTYKNKILRIILVFIIISIAMSRFMLGVHYPSDVLVGFIFGIVCMNIFDKLSASKNKVLVYLIILIVGGVGIFFCKSDDYFTGLGMLIGSLAGELFESKYVNFKETNNILEIIVRILPGLGIFFAVSALCKLPFSEAFLQSQTLAAYLCRTARYAINVFITIGVYPLCFKYIKFKK